VSTDTLELQMLAALQRHQALQRRMKTGARDPGAIACSTIAELGEALEELRVAHEQIIEDGYRTEELVSELAARRARYWALFDEMPGPYLVTRPDTTITEVNRAAAELLNVSQRFLAGKTLSIFVNEDRGRFLDESTRVAREQVTADYRVKLRPRERAPLMVSMRVRGDGASLRWIVTP
jgi:PAS domain S-box-containing protein